MVKIVDGNIAYVTKLMLYVGMILLFIYMFFIGGIVYIKNTIHFIY
jgi:hypothetical protein